MANLLLELKQNHAAALQSADTLFNSVGTRLMTTD